VKLWSTALLQERYLFYAGLVAVGALAVAGGSTILADDGRSGPNSVRARLTGSEENPPIATAASGTFTAQIDDENETITFVLTYAGIEGGTTSAAHIHFAPRRVNGGVSAFLCGGGSKPACPPLGGTVTGVITAADVIGPVGQGIDPGEFDQLVAAIRAGLTYVNVHSTPRFPNGEIRGQIRAGGGDNQGRQ
jgi:hypothetical protein